MIDTSPANAAQRKERLHNLIDVTLKYRASSKTDLAQFLGRDNSRLYPDTDNPKLDLIVGLAQALDWPVDAVVDYVWNGEAHVSRVAGCSAPRDFATCRDETIAALNRGDYDGALRLSQGMQSLAGSAAEKAWGLRLWGLASEAQGHYGRAVAAYRRGLECSPISRSERLALQINLAGASYCQWDLTSALAVAQYVARQFVDARPADLRESVTEAVAYYVSGSSQRRLMTVQPEAVASLAQEARGDLLRAIDLFEQIVREYEAEDCGAMAQTCRGALLEVEAALGLLEPQNALEQVRAALAVLEQPPDAWPKGDGLESLGWWCEFGANIAFRHLPDAQLQRYVEPFSESLLDVARLLRNWALIERAVSIQHAMHQRIVEVTGMKLPYPLDSEHVDLIAGAVGRFPRLRGDGWEILNGAARAAARKG